MLPPWYLFRIALLCLCMSLRHCSLFFSKYRHMNKSVPLSFAVDSVFKMRADPVLQRPPSVCLSLGKLCPAVTVQWRWSWHLDSDAMVRAEFSGWSCISFTKTLFWRAPEFVLYFKKTVSLTRLVFLAHCYEHLMTCTSRHHQFVRWWKVGSFKLGRWGLVLVNGQGISIKIPQSGTIMSF